MSDNISQNIEKIVVWAHSFQQNSDGEVILLAANATPDDEHMLNTYNIPYKKVSLVSDMTVNNERLITQKEYLKYREDIDVVLITDVFDVVFQNDPFKKLDFKTGDLFFGGEGVLHQEEPWNMDVITKSFYEQKHFIKDKEVLCSGVMAGKREAMIDLLEEMWVLCVEAEGHDIRDQAALNIIFYLQQIPYKMKRLTLLDDWVLHCATGGPTQFFEAWGFKNILDRRYKVPSYETYDIVHQFNRISTWQNILTAPYAKR